MRVRPHFGDMDRCCLMFESNEAETKVSEKRPRTADVLAVMLRECEVMQ